MQINEEGLNLIKTFEGCRLNAYKDLAGIWTIGYGCTRDVEPGLAITQGEADVRLFQDLKEFEEGILRLVKTPINQNEFSALVCLAYNIGLGRFKNSKILSYLNQGLKEKVPDQFLRFCLIKGEVSRGLANRREAERKLFKKPV